MYKTITINIGDFYNKQSCGFSKSDLEEIAKEFRNTAIFNLLDCFEDKSLRNTIRSNIDGEPCLLLIKNGVNQIRNGLRDEISMEQFKLEPLTNKVSYSRRHKRIINKHARHHMTFGEKNIEPDYENNISRQIALKNVPKTKEYMDTIVTKLHTLFPEKKLAKFIEVNYYPEKKGGIGFHGDSERKIAISARFGSTAPIAFQWFHRSKAIGKMFCIDIEPGDFYIMAEKTTGFDWKCSSRYTLRHAAISKKYMTIAKKYL